MGEFGNPGGYVMVGKTFKGLTDAILRWQTDRFQELEVHRTASTIWVEPGMVVEIAIDGVQKSGRYPGGIALRFARVKRYLTTRRRQNPTPFRACAGCYVRSGSPEQPVTAVTSRGERISAR